MSGFSYSSCSSDLFLATSMLVFLSLFSGESLTKIRRGKQSYCIEVS